MENSTRISIPASLRAWLPSRGNVVFTLLVVMALFWAQAANALPWSAPAAAATSTGTWPYQGRLADSTGTPITATVSMIFRLYSASTGGVPLWEEQWTGPNSVQVSDGLFNVMLGSLSAIPQSVVTNNGSLWLGITAGTDSEMTPRVQLGSVPFAAQALTVPDNSILTAKIADANITTAKIADGAVTQAKLGSDISLVPPDGSITTAKLVDGAVTKAKLGADVSFLPPNNSITTPMLQDKSVTSRKVTLTSGFTSVNSMAPITTQCYTREARGTSQTVTVDTDSILFANVVYDFSTSDTSTVAVGVLYVNGQIAGPESAQSGGRSSVAQNYYVTLTPGTYTLRVAYCKQGAGTASDMGLSTITWFVFAR